MALCSKRGHGARWSEFCPRLGSKYRFSSRVFLGEGGGRALRKGVVSSPFPFSIVEGDQQAERWDGEGAREHKRDPRFIE